MSTATSSSSRSCDCCVWIPLLLECWKKLNRESNCFVQWRNGGLFGVLMLRCWALSPSPSLPTARVDTDGSAGGGINVEFGLGVMVLLCCWLGTRSGKYYCFYFCGFGCRRRVWCGCHHCVSVDDSKGLSVECVRIVTKMLCRVGRVTAITVSLYFLPASQSTPDDQSIWAAKYDGAGSLNKEGEMQLSYLSISCLWCNISLSRSTVTVVSKDFQSMIYHTAPHSNVSFVMVGDSCWCIGGSSGQPNGFGFWLFVLYQSVVHTSCHNWRDGCSTGLSFFFERSLAWQWQWRFLAR